MTIGHKIKQRRLRRGLTQWQLGKRIGVTRSAMANFENGYRRIRRHYRNRLEVALR